MTFKAPTPDPFLYEFNNANLEIDYDMIPFCEKKGKLTVVLSEKNLLPRGAKSKQNKFIIGVNVYTGRDTKIMMNSEDTHIK